MKKLLNLYTKSTKFWQIVFWAVVLFSEGTLPVFAATSDEIQEWLLGHNTYRSLHGVSNVTWSSTVAQSAQAWADTCPSSHSGSGYGENLAWATYDMGENSVVQMWYDEEQLYDYNNPGFSSATGHFSQVVWKGTTEIGCGFATGCGNDWPYMANVWVCQYNPHGNVIGQFETNVFPPTVDGDSDGYASSIDCDDEDNTVYPGAVELCDGILNNCNSSLSISETDDDGDGYVECSPIDAGGWDGPGIMKGGDCNDNDINEHPNQIWYYDFDIDGYHDGTINSTSCTRPVNYFIGTELSSLSVVDNCPADYNPDQADADSPEDGIGNACDEGDADGDGFTDIEETICGSDPGDITSRCSIGFPWLMLLLGD